MWRARYNGFAPCLSSLRTGLKGDPGPRVEYAVLLTKGTCAEFRGAGRKGPVKMTGTAQKRRSLQWAEGRGSFERILERMKDFFYRMVCGLVIGIGGVLPGVSGGIMAISMGLYEKMMSAIGHFFTGIRKNIAFLLPIVLGGGIGILLTSNALKVVLETYEGPVLALFCGLVLGSLPDLVVEAKGGGGGFGKRHVVALICGMAFVLLFALGESSVSTNAEVGGLNILTSLIAGGVLSIGVVIPGVSSSFLLIYIGLYNAVLSAIAGVMDLSILFSQGVGAALENLGNQIVPLLFMIIGFAIVALLIIKGVNAMLKRHHALSYAAIIGFVIGSVALIAPKMFVSFHWSCIPLFALGLVVSLAECRAHAKRRALDLAAARAVAEPEDVVAESPAWDKAAESGGQERP